MKEFIEKWQTDSKFKAKTKLGLSTLFVLFVAIFAFSIRDDSMPLNDVDTSFPGETEKINYTKLSASEKYDVNVLFNDQEIKYSYSEDDEKQVILKKQTNETTKYVYDEDEYYKEISGQYIKTSQEEVYDIVDYNYINFNTINQYLKASEYEENEYIVYLNDIILGNDSEEFITIKQENNKTTIDYTSLIKTFDKTAEKLLVEVIIEDEE